MPDVDVIITPQPDVVVTVTEDESPPVAITLTSPPSVVTVGVPGPAGPPGAPGPSGSDLTYVHNQDIASDTWTVNHNLGKFPTPTVVDTSGNELVSNIQHTSVNQLIVTHSVATSGKVYCN